MVMHLVEELCGMGLTSEGISLSDAGSHDPPNQADQLDPDGRRRDLRLLLPPFVASAGGSVSPDVGEQRRRALEAGAVSLARASSRELGALALDEVGPPWPLRRVLSQCVTHCFVVSID